MKAILNERFVEESPKGMKNRELIEIIFEFKEAIVDMANPYSNHQALHEDLHNWEYALQEAFGFPQDKNYHRFWEWPGCTCPFMDNLDNWGTKYKVHIWSCPVHGAVLEGGKDGRENREDSASMS